MESADALVADVNTQLSMMSMAGIIRLCATIVIGILAIRVIVKLLDTALEHNESLSSVKRYVHSVVNVVLWFILILIVAGSLGIQVTSLIALFSVAGLAISLALQNTLSNLAGGIQIMMIKPFEPGHYVSIDGTDGTVEAVSIAYTTLTTVDNKSIFVPNSQVANAKIVNFTRLGRRRIDTVFTTSYDAPTETVLTALQEAFAAVPEILTDPAPMAHLSDYGSSSISYDTRVWCNGSDYWTVYYALREAVRPAFARHGIEMTYDHLNVHMVQ